MLVKGNKLPLREIALYGFLPAWLKKAIYRRRGYSIPASVKLGPGSVIVGSKVTLGEEVRIGPLSFIVGREIDIGPRVHIGMLSFISVYDFAVGEGTRINNQVVIGGMATPRSSFRMGKNGILMEWSFVNTTEPVTIGDNVGIGGHCLFFTHGMWPNAFEGYPFKYGPIHIEDDVWLAWRVSVLPGVTIGRGTIVSSDACVTGSLPEGALTGGVPARVIREGFTYKKAMDDDARAQLLAGLLAEFAEWLRFHGFEVESEGANGDGRLVIARGGVKRTLVVWSGPDRARAIPAVAGETALVSTGEIDDKVRAELAARGIPWLDVSKAERSRHTNDLADETEEFLRRRGLRTIKYGSRSQ